MRPLRGRVNDGELTIYAKNTYDNYLERLDNKEIVFTIAEYREKRTPAQNDYYWWILQYIEEETGNDKNNLHQLFKDMFLAEEVIVLDHESKSYVSTTKLNTKEMTDYIEKIRQHMNDWGLYIPEANEAKQIIRR